jgi:alpha,alpha-trehalose phosphorylase
VAAEIGDTELAYRYFMKTARMDLDNVNGNVADGVHTAAMAGTWLSLIYGFGGMRDHDGDLTFSPGLPRAWEGLQFRILWRGTMLEVRVDRDETTYRLPQGGRLSLHHNGESVAVSGSEQISVEN